MLVLHHEQARPYVEDDTACSDGCEYAAELSFAASDCALCTEREKAAEATRLRAVEKRRAKAAEKQRVPAR